MYDKLYSQILKWTFRRNRVDAAEREGFIESLITPMRQLHAAYQESGDIHVDYADRAIRSAYLLRYFLPYSLICELALGVADLEIGSNDKVALLGAGPCPELIGLLNYLKGQARVPRKLKIHTFDCNANGWREARQLTFSRLAPIVHEAISIRRWSHEFDLGNLPNVLPSGIRRAKLIIVQHCMNEISTRFGADQLLSIAHQAQPGSTLLVIERRGYEGVRQALGQAAARHDEVHADVIFGPRELQANVRHIYDDLPGLVRDRLLYVQDGWREGLPPNQDGLTLQNRPYYWVLALRRR